jgi:serine phosphatase RsbU (regulator of sigma subunit)
VIDDFKYVSQFVQLAPGDMLCIITDGVTEAMNAHGDLYGSNRLQAALASVPAGHNLGVAIDHVRSDISKFVGAAEPSDDLTLLMLRWHPVTCSAGSQDISAR